MTHPQHKMMKDDGVCVFMLIEVCRVAVSVADRWQGVKQSVRGVGRVFLEHRRPFENISPGRRSRMQMREMILTAVLNIRCRVFEHDLLQFPYRRV